MSNIKLLFFGEPLVEIYNSKQPFGMMLDSKDGKPGNLDHGLHHLIDNPGSLGFSGDITNMTVPAQAILTSSRNRHKTEVLTAIGDKECACSTQYHSGY